MFKRFFFSFLIGIYTLQTQAKVADFDAILACHTTPKNPGIAVRIEQAGKHVYSGAAGVANIKTLRSLNIDDVFPIASVTKTFTAAAILKLSEEKKLSLKHTIGKYIPNINPDYKNLTIERVLSHTSGLPDYLNDKSITSIWDEYASIDKVIKMISKRPVISRPGTEYNYSNTGYIILGKIIEVSSGMPYDQFMKQRFFEPLKMINTSVVTKSSAADSVNGYTTNLTDPEKYLNAEDSTNRQWKVDRSWVHAAGAISSTLADMSRWQKALKSGRVISPDNYRLMTTKAKLTGGKAVNYGLGINIYPIRDKQTFNHEGMLPGFASWNVYFPKDDLTAIAFSNLGTQHPGPALLNMIAVQLKLSPKPISPHEFNSTAKALIGSYRYSDGKELKISADGNLLFSQLDGKNKRRLVLRQNNSFSYECTEDYFELRNSDKKAELVPIYIYHGEQQALIKL